jgi:hypothetical protein
MRKALVLISLFVVALLVPLQGNAATFFLSGGSDGSGSGGSLTNPHRITAHGFAVGTAYSTLIGGQQVNFVCEATSTGIVSQTAIQECRLENTVGGRWYAQPRSLPGNFSITLRSSTVPNYPMRVCWVARATFILNAEDVYTNGCTPYR